MKTKSKWPQPYRRLRFSFQSMDELYPAKPARRRREEHARVEREQTRTWAPKVGDLDGRVAPGGLCGHASAFCFRTRTRTNRRSRSSTCLAWSKRLKTNVVSASPSLSTRPTRLRSRRRTGSWPSGRAE